MEVRKLMECMLECNGNHRNNNLIVKVCTLANCLKYKMKKTSDQMQKQRDTKVKVDDTMVIKNSH